ncbi:MAG: DUF742 domain-containing protein [Acidimicrobiales bacterium]
MAPSLHDDPDEFDRYEDEFDDEPMIRPFMVTGGRTDAALPVEAMVVDAAAGRAELPGMEEYRRIYRLCAEPQAIAELSAKAKLPLGVVRVLVSDLVESQALNLAASISGSDDELDFIDRIIMAVEAM